MLWTLSVLLKPKSSVNVNLPAVPRVRASLFIRQSKGDRSKSRSQTCYIRSCDRLCDRDFESKANMLVGRVILTCCHDSFKRACVIRALLIAFTRCQAPAPARRKFEASLRVSFTLSRDRLSDCKTMDNEPLNKDEKSIEVLAHVWEPLLSSKKARLL